MTSPSMRRPLAAFAHAALLWWAVSCTNDYDGFSTGGGAGVGSTATASVVASSVSAVAVSSSASSSGSSASSSSSSSGGDGGGGGGDGGAGGAGGTGGGEGGAGGEVPLPGSVACADRALDFQFLIGDLPSPWTRDTSGEVVLESGDGLFTATFDGNARDRGGIVAPLVWSECSMTLSLPEDQVFDELESVRVAAYLGAVSPSGPLPSLVVLSAVDGNGAPLPTQVGAVRLPTSNAPLSWTLGPVERRGVRFLRLRRTGGSLFYDVTDDGVAWDTLGEILAEPDRVTLGAWKDSVLQSEESVRVVLGPVNP